MTAITTLLTPIPTPRTRPLNLTPKQLRIVQLIRETRLIKGYSPTIKELAEATGVTRVTVFEHIEALIRKGVLKRQAHKARSLSIVEDAPLPDEAPPLQFPLVGRIAAGMPIEKCAQDDMLDLEQLIGPRVGSNAGTFALQVEGDSMQDEGILDGDYVLVERRNTARNGERVVALLPDGETTLKTLFREPDGRIRLQPANEAFEPIIVEDCQIQGVVTAVLRSYR
jgi:repressor LexA